MGNLQAYWPTHQDLLARKSGSCQEILIFVECLEVYNICWQDIFCVYSQINHDSLSRVLKVYWPRNLYFVGQKVLKPTYTEIRMWCVGDSFKVYLPRNQDDIKFVSTHQEIMMCWWNSLQAYSPTNQDVLTRNSWKSTSQEINKMCWWDRIMQ